MHDLVPRPDPTLLTTQQLVREIAGLRVELGNELMAVRSILETRLDANDKALDVRRLADQRDIAAVRELLETRLGGMDKAIELLRTYTDAFPDRIDEKLLALQAVHEEKFSSIETQFRERDIRTEQTSRDSKVAVDAALQAAKEAVEKQNNSSALAIAKSEAATDKRIDQQGLQIQTSAKATDDKIGDIKERLTRIEGMGQGKIQQTGTWIAGAGLLVAAAVLVSRFL